MEGSMTRAILERCEERGIRITEQRKAIVRALEKSNDHPNVEELYQRALEEDRNISIASVYRTVKLLEELGVLERHDFGGGRARYEDADRAHHDHLIDINSGEVIEFLEPDLEALQIQVAKRYGFELKGHRLELYGIRVRNEENEG